MKTVCCFAVLWTAIFIGHAGADLPAEVEALLRKNEEASSRLASYTYTLDYKFTQYEESNPGNVVEESGHEGFVAAEGRQLSCDLVTYSSNITDVYPNGQFRNIFVRNDDYMCWVERQPKNFTDEGEIASACLYDFADVNEWPVERKAMEGARSFDLVPFAFGFHRFSAGLHADVARYSVECTINASQNDKGQEITISPKTWKSGSSIVLRFSGASGLLSSKSFYDIDGRLFCQTDVVESEIGGVSFPSEVRDRRYKKSEKSGESVMIREFVAKAADIRVNQPVNEENFRLSALRLPDNSSIGWYSAEDRIMKYGLKVSEHVAKPISTDDVSFVDSNNQPTQVDRSVVYF